MSTYVTVAQTIAVPEGTVRVVELDGRSIALCHVAGNGIYAIDNRCTHDNGPLGEGTLRENRIECPRHGALFDVHTGQAKTLPAVGKVHTYSVRISAGDVQIALDG